MTFATDTPKPLSQLPVARDQWPLGIIGEYVAKPCSRQAKEVGRLTSRAMKMKAANLLQSQDEKHALRLSSCGQTAFGSGVSLVSTKQADGTVGAHFTGLVTCQSVWACPSCSKKISEKRRDELNDLLAWARAENHGVAMLTLTASHKRNTAIAPFLSDLKDALKALRQSSAWRSLRLIGSVVATEVTHGRNGFHPHMHVMLILPAGAGDPVQAIETFRERWLHVLKIYGRSGNRAAFQVQSASMAGDYIAKFGPAEELALQTAKTGREGSRNPWQLLRDATHGDKQASALWCEYVAAFKGRRQLQWSNGLKALVQSERSDDAPEPEPVQTVVRLWHSQSNSWREARRRMVAIVMAVETGTDIDDAIRGPTDSERWRKLEPDGQVIEPCAA